jgi:antitoxin component YwqK of YwqJK toxin-antitoxin module
LKKTSKPARANIIYPNGKIREVQYYQDGKRINWDTCYFENGSFQLISQYGNGKLQGEQYKFDTNNQITHKAVFNQDTLVRFIPVEGK